MRRRQDFNNCSVLVVGGTSGINLGIAEGFVDGGWSLAGVSTLGEMMKKQLRSATD